MLSSWLLSHQYNDQVVPQKTAKPLTKGDISRLQAQRLSKLYFTQPTMWSHRLINVKMEIWPIQSPKNFFLNGTSFYDFIFGRGMINDIDSFLMNLGITTKISDGRKKIVSVENVTIVYHDYSTVKKNYNLTFYKQIVDGFYPKSIQEVVMVAKTIIFIMNETDPEELNYTNYGNLVYWYIQNLKEMEDLKDEFFGPLVAV